MYECNNALKIQGKYFYWRKKRQHGWARGSWIPDEVTYFLFFFFFWIIKHSKYEFKSYVGLFFFFKNIQGENLIHISVVCWMTKGGQQSVRSRALQAFMSYCNEYTAGRNGVRARAPQLERLPKRVVNSSPPLISDVPESPSRVRQLLAASSWAERIRSLLPLSPAH